MKQKAAKRRRCIGAPAAFRRLCVETLGYFDFALGVRTASRLQAAVC